MLTVEQRSLFEHLCLRLSVGALGVSSTVTLLHCPHEPKQQLSLHHSLQRSTRQGNMLNTPPPPENRLLSTCNVTSKINAVFLFFCKTIHQITSCYSCIVYGYKMLLCSCSDSVKPNASSVFVSALIRQAATTEATHQWKAGAAPTQTVLLG